MRLIGKTGEIKTGDLVGEAPIGKLVSVVEPNEQYPKGLLMVRWSGSETPKETLPSDIGAHFTV